MEIFSLIISMVKAGEAGGSRRGDGQLAIHFENQHDLEEKIRSATTYPIIVSCLAVVVMAVMVFSSCRSLPISSMRWASRCRC